MLPMLPNETDRGTPPEVSERSSLFHFVGQFADAFDFTGDHIAGFQEFRGSKPIPTPAGVPMAMMVPACKVMP